MACEARRRQPPLRLPSRPSARRRAGSRRPRRGSADATRLGARRPRPGARASGRIRCRRAAPAAGRGRSAAVPPSSAGARAGPVVRGRAAAPGARIQPARYSIRSSSVGEAQCTSSRQTSRGWSRASSSRKRRIAQNVSSAAAAPSTCPTAVRISSAIRAPSSTPARSAVSASLAARFADDVAHRPEGDRLSVRETTPAKRPEPSLEPLEELRDETRLPDPGRADDRQQAAAATEPRMPRVGLV